MMEPSASSLLDSKDQELQSVAASLIETTDQLVSLYDLSKGSPSSLSPEELLRYLVKKVTDVVDCKAVLLIDANETKTFAGDRQLQRKLVDLWSQAESKDVLYRADGSALASDVAVIHFSECSSGGVVVYASERVTTQYRKLMDTVVAYIDGVLAVSELHKVEVRNALLNRDIETAGLLADQVMPKWTPEVSGIEVAARCNYARLASGDFYTYAETPYGLLAAVGDVSGKGLPAALVMSMVSTAVTIAGKQVSEPDPQKIMGMVNQSIYEYLSAAGVFVTIAIATWDASEAVLSISNAGHSPVLLVTNRVETVKAGGPPLGVLPENPQDLQRFMLAEKTYVLLGSDGLAEQEDPQGEQLGYENLAQVSQSLHGKSSAEIVEGLFAAVTEHAAGAEQDDDRTALVLQRAK